MCSRARQTSCAANTAALPTADEGGACDRRVRCIRSAAPPSRTSRSFTDQPKVGAFAVTSPARTYLDVQGLTCPVPLLRTRRHLRSMQVGDTVEVHATDPHSKGDFEAVCDGVICELVSLRVDGSVYQYVVRKL